MVQPNFRLIPEIFNELQRNAIPQTWSKLITENYKVQWNARKRGRGWHFNSYPLHGSVHLPHQISGRFLKLVDRDSDGQEKQTDGGRTTGRTGGWNNDNTCRCQWRPWVKIVTSHVFRFRSINQVGDVGSFEVNHLVPRDAPPSRCFKFT